MAIALKEKKLKYALIHSEPAGKREIRPLEMENVKFL